MLLIELLQLEDSPYSYSLHVELINLLKKQGELDLLRSAREHMGGLFPLTEGTYVMRI